jgi:tetratricopeptide (TPR) repeat protein
VDGATPSLQDILRQRQQDTFVGRDSRLAEFRTNLGLPPDDPRRHYIVNIYGIAGVGKSFLLQQFRRIAQEQGATYALANEDYFDVVETMSALAADFARQGVRLTEFENQLATYRQRRRELESDPNAPLGDLITTTTVRAGVALVKSVPGAGAITEIVDPDAVAMQANRLRAYLVQRFSKKSDVELLLSPIDVLTRSFVSSINGAAEARPVTLFFDTFERTAPYLEDWLLDLLTGKFDWFSSKVVTTIAGQLALADNRWSPLRSLIAAHPLEPFTEEEARDFLVQRGVTSEAVIEVILPLSGRVPMWLATLADSNPQDPGSIPDPSEGAVERFLKWEPDERRRTLARTAALPRRFNRDVLLAVADRADVSELFGWLLHLPFVSRTTDYWRYHDAVRDPILRLARITSPQQWRDQHRVLADYFLQEQVITGLPADRRWSDGAWQALALEECYHRLCAAPAAALPQALEAAVEAAVEGITLARRWAAMFTEAGGASGDERLRSWGKRLTDLLKDQDDDTAFLTALIESGELGPESYADALAVRGDSHRLHHRLEEARAELDRAVGLRPGQARIHRWRGLTYQALNLLDEALDDFTRAIELDRSPASCHTHRGITYRLMNRHDEALADFNRAIELEPQIEWHRAQRGLEYQLLGRYTEAIADFDRALEIDPGSAWCYEQRAMTYRLAERFEEAIADFDRALEIDPESDSSLGERGYTYHLLGETDTALRDLDRALEMNPEASGNYVLRGSIRDAAGRYEDALADFDRAVGIDPQDGMLFAQRGAFQRGALNFEAALEDLDRALELGFVFDWVYSNRGACLRMLGRFYEAVADFERSLELNPNDTWVIAELGLTYSGLGNYEEAAAQFTRSLELVPDAAWELAQRGAFYLVLGRLEASLGDLDRAIELDPGADWVYVQRSVVHRVLERFEEGLADIDRAEERSQEDGDTWRLKERAEILRAMGRYGAAIAVLDHAVELDPFDPEALCLRGELHRLTGNPDAAIADLDTAVELAPADSWARSLRGMARQSMGNREEALADFRAAVEAEPTDGRLRFLEGLALNAVGDREAGAETIRAAMDLVTADSRPVLAGAFHGPTMSCVRLLAMGRVEEAREALAEVLRASDRQTAVLVCLEWLDYLAECPGLDVEGVGKLAQLVAAYRIERLAPE